MTYRQLDIGHPEPHPVQTGQAVTAGGTLIPIPYVIRMATHGPSNRAM